MTKRLAPLAASLLLAASAFAAPATATAQTTLSFETPVTTASTAWTAPLAAIDGYEFFNFRIMSLADPFGVGANAASGSQFAYAGYDFGAIYRTDLSFNLFGAFLSFRSTDGAVDPLQVVVSGYRGASAAPVFERTLSLTTDAQRFDLGILGVDEVVFDVVDDTRFAVLAVDDVTLSAVPEPGTIVLVATGFVAVAGVARRRQGASRR